MNLFILFCLHCTWILATWTEGKFCNVEKATLLGSFRIKLIHYLDRVTDIWQRAVEIYQNNKKIMRNRNKICVALQDKSDKLLLT